MELTLPEDEQLNNSSQAEEFELEDEMGSAGVVGGIRPGSIGVQQQEVKVSWCSWASSRAAAEQEHGGQAATRSSMRRGQEAADSARAWSRAADDGATAMQ